MTLLTSVWIDEYRTEPVTLTSLTLSPGTPFLVPLASLISLHTHTPADAHTCRDVLGGCVALKNHRLFISWAFLHCAVAVSFLGLALKGFL